MKLDQTKPCERCGAPYPSHYGKCIPSSEYNPEQLEQWLRGRLLEIRERKQAELEIEAAPIVAQLHRLLELKPPCIAIVDSITGLPIVGGD